MEMNYPLWKSILEYAIWAPSPHNTQPWKIKIISEAKAELHYDPKRLLPVEDKNNAFQTLALGIFIETLNIAAHKVGYEVHEEYINMDLNESSTDSQIFAILTLTQTLEKENLDASLILKRRTSRLPYNGKIIDEHILNELIKIAKNYHHIIHFRTDKPFIDWVLKLNQKTLFYDMSEKRTKEEVGRWLRYSQSSAKKKRDGLSAYCMKFPGIVMYLFFHKRGLFELPVIKDIIDKLYIYSMRGTTTVGWIEGSWETSEDWINAGKMLIRLWLTMTSHEVYLHPFGSIITNPHSHEEIKNALHIDESKAKVWLLFRTGYSNIPPRSYRLPENDIIVES